MRTRKGITLIELLAAMVLLGVLLAAAQPLFQSLLRQTTARGREVQTDRTLDHLLARLRRDLAGAAGVTALGSDGNLTLAIGEAGKEVRYESRDGRVVRTTRDGNEAAAWDVPGACIEWRPWPDANAPHALEVRTSVWTGAGRERRQALSRTHLFFLHATPAEGTP